MKRILIASAVAFAAGGQALAADLPPPMAPPPRAPAMYVPVVPLYNWTGFYIGGNVGAGWNSTGSIHATAWQHFWNNNQHLVSGWRPGRRQLRVRWRRRGRCRGHVRLAAQHSKHNQCNSTLQVGHQSRRSATINNRWLTTATGKLGYAWDRVLLYGKGGGAWVGTSNPSITVSRRTGLVR